MGIKAARVVQSLQENHQLDVTALHAIGWRYVKVVLAIFITANYTKTNCSYGADIVNALASEIVFSKMGKMGRLTLLDPGRRLETFNIAGNPVKQIGFYNKESVTNNYSWFLKDMLLIICFKTDICCFC